MKDALDFALEPTRWLILNHLKREPRTFVWLRETMMLSDGNLSAHIRALQRYRLVGFRKTFKARKPVTTYYLSKYGEAIIPKVLTFVNEAGFDDLEKALIKKVAEPSVNLEKPAHD